MGPERWEAQNFALCFPLQPQFSFCLPSLGVFAWNFGVFESRDPPRNTFGNLELSCETQSRRGFTRRLESPNVHIGVSRPSKTPPQLEKGKNNELGRKGKRNLGKGSSARRSCATGPARVRRPWSEIQTNNNHNNNHNNAKMDWLGDRGKGTSLVVNCTPARAVLAIQLLGLLSRNEFFFF